MLHTIENQRLRVTVSDHGAELQSIYGLDYGVEYLWQGDPRYWEDRAPNLFPYIARLTDGRYSYRGSHYSMRIHGLAPYADFELTQKAADSMTFLLRDDPSSLAQYPFHFALRICYRLSENCLHTTYSIENRDTKEMFFAVGGHPGINVPLDGDAPFSAWRLEFPQPCAPLRVGFSEDCFVTGENLPFPLEAGQLPLRHDMFDDDAIVLTNVSPEVRLCSDASERSVTLRFSGFPYLGVWHWPGKEAPYVCLEPWSSLPSRKGVTEDLETQPDLIRLQPGAQAQREWTLELA